MGNVEHLGLEAAGVAPLIVPAFGAERLDLDALLQMVDGVLLTGSRSNLDPSLYGKTATEENGPYDRMRDATTLPLIGKEVGDAIEVNAPGGARGYEILRVEFI